MALCCVSIASAQSGFSIKSFTELTQDLDARVTYPVTDQNGQKCALVKIYTTESNFSFDNGLLGVTLIINLIPKGREIKAKIIYKLIIV